MKPADIQIGRKYRNRNVPPETVYLGIYLGRALGKAMVLIAAPDYDKHLIGWMCLPPEEEHFDLWSGFEIIPEISVDEL